MTDGPLTVFVARQEGGCCEGCGETYDRIVEGPRWVDPEAPDDESRPWSDPQNRNAQVLDPRGRVSLLLVCRSCLVKLAILVLEQEVAG